MPPKKRVVVESSDEEEEELVPSQSQSSSTQLSSDDILELAGKICNYLLMNECRKISSKAADMRKLVLTDKGRYFNQVMKKASELMEEAYGFKIVALKKKDYILVNSLKMSETMLVNSVTTSDEVKGLLTIILIGIFMSGGLMHEGPMREYLKNFQVDLDTQDSHPVFGNVDRLLHQDLRKQNYIEITLDKTVDPSTREYRWGERAHLEFPKKQILELVCKVYGNNMRPEMWLSQWRDLQKESN